MESSLGPLKYQPLKPNHIRLFGISIGSNDDEVAGTMIEQNLDVPDNKIHLFLALSYIWGDFADEVATIKVKNYANNHRGTLTITMTLWNKLRNLRSLEYITWVWVDQICIDQGNDREKEVQILLMRIIYQKAMNVVAMIDSPDKTDFAMDLLYGDEWSNIVPFDRALNVALQRLGQEPTPANRAHAMAAVNLLLGHRYWKRMWIWQEVTAKDEGSLVRFGGKQVRLKSVMMYIISYKQYNLATITEDRDAANQPIWDMTPFIDFWASRRIGWDSSLLAVLDEVRLTEITDPRDKVFAALPFSSDGIQDFRPDYSKTTHEIYTKFALWHIVKYQSLDVITFSKGDFGRFPIKKEDRRITTKVGELHHEDDTEPTEEFEDYTLASWVPDWRAKCHTLHGEKWKEDRRIWSLPKSEHIYDPTLPRIFKASGPAPPAFQVTFPDTKIFINGLTVHGVKVATINHVQRDKLPDMISLVVEEEWYRDFQAAKISNWDYAGDHLFKRTIYADITFRSQGNIVRHARSTSPDEQLIWPHVTQVEDVMLQLGNLKHITNNRGPFRTRTTSEGTTGLYGLGPAWARGGDEIWILKGASVPFVLRRGKWMEQTGSTNADLITQCIEPKTYYPGDPILSFVGECFILGLMDGEVLDLMGLDDGDPRRAQVPELEREFHPITLF